MPYAGPGDKQLPPAVQKLPRKLRELWVRVFNETFDAEDEGAAFRAAWGAVRAADKEKQMNIVQQIVAGLRKPAEAEKAVNLAKWQDAVYTAFAAEFGIEPGEEGEEDEEDKLEAAAMVFEVQDDHVIARTFEGTGGWFKVPYTKTMAAVDGSSEEVVASVTFAPRAEWVPVTPVFAEFKAFEQADGRVRWTLVSSGGFEDRDGEIVATAALEAAVKAADQTGERGPLLLYHVPGSNIGAVDFQAVIGEPGFLLESGLFDASEDGQRSAQYALAHAKELGASIKFLYANQTPDGVFLPPIWIVERSLLPRGKAAFPWSALDIAEVQKMAKLSQEKQQMLEEVLGKDRAVAIIAQVEASAEALKEAGVRFKELGAPGGAGATTEAAEPTPVSDEPDLTPTDEPAGEVAKEADASPAPAAPLTDYELVLTPEAIAAVAEKAAGAVAQQIAGLHEQLKALQGTLDGQTNLRTVVEKLAQDVEAIKRADDAKIAEKVANLPRATVRAMQAPELYRATAQKQASEPDDAAGQEENYLDRLTKVIHG